jgi:protease-4
MIALGLGAKRVQQIAVVEMEGTIGPRLRAADYARLFRSLSENDRVRGVVLDIDSPGGSATASNFLHLAVQALARKKPVVAFFRGTGASGAYLFALPAQKIVAIPSALIGSIGVISMRPLIYEAMDRLSLKMSVTKSDKFKDMGSMFRPPTPEEEEKEQELVDDLYEQFLEAVMEGRKMDREQAKAVATGEVFTARKAKDLGLVDELGDLEHAIDVAADLAKAPRKPVWVRPKRGLREVLTSLAASSFAAELAGQVEDRLQTRIYYQRL